MASDPDDHVTENETLKALDDDVLKKVPEGDSASVMDSSGDTRKIVGNAI